MSADSERQGISEAAASTIPTGASARGGTGEVPGTGGETSTPIIQSVYRIGFGRKFILLVIFLLLLPFFLSMPVMLTMRLLHGKFADAASLGAMAVFLGVALAFIYLQYKAALMTRIELEEDQVKLSLPTWRGPMPFAPFVEASIPYEEIGAVEQRGELYRALGVLGLRKVSCLVKKDDTRIVLGYETEDEIDAPIPFSRIADELATNCSLKVVNKGAINAGTQLGAAFAGTPAWDTPPITTEDTRHARRRARLFLGSMIAGFIVLVLIAIVLTFLPEIQSLLMTPEG